MAIGVIWADIWDEAIWDTSIWAQASGNSAPTDIQLSNSTVSVNGGSNAVVGILSTTDADIGDSHTYTLVAGTGDTDNASFNINGSQLRCADPASTGVGTYSVRVQTSDGTDTYAEAFTLNIVEPSSFGLVQSLTRSLSRSITRNLAS